MTTSVRGRNLILNTKRFCEGAPVDFAIRHEAVEGVKLLLQKFDGLVASLCANERVLKVYTKTELESKSMEELENLMELSGTISIK